jgi:4'-phosphopantetheinyl transferase
MSAPPVPPLAPGAVHVWRVRLDDEPAARALRPLLSADERGRADRFIREEHRVRFTVAHGWKRRILARYVESRPARLAFACAEHGKPSLVDSDAHGVHFNLSHSADLALVAVRRGGPVGVDVESWSREIAHLELAERFFSPNECRALSALAGDRRAVVAGFFAAWSRKEAYLKATGDGITRGLDHFDVSLTPGEPAALLADRLDPDATRRWVLTSLDVAPGYSAALVSEAPLADVVLLDTVSVHA